MKESRYHTGDNRKKEGVQQCLLKVSYFDPPHFVGKFGVKFKIVSRSYCLCIWLLIEDLILGM